MTIFVTLQKIHSCLRENEKKIELAEIEKRELESLLCKVSLSEMIDGFVYIFSLYLTNIQWKENVVAKWWIIHSLLHSPKGD